MKRKIFLSGSLLKESFFEVDRKTRTNIYIYFLYILLIRGLITFLLENLFLLDLYGIILPPFLEPLFIFLWIMDVTALINLSLKRTTNVVIGWYIKIFASSEKSVGEWRFG